MTKTQNQVDFATKQSMGVVTVTPVKLFNAKGERIEFKIRATRKNKSDKGTLAIRCRKATQEDIEFVEVLRQGKHDPDYSNW